MTIKEIEQLAGMSRANIRFYEQEGLLNPVRTANGYRDYSEEDLEILKRIRLLRSLHVPLEEIKAMAAGDRNLKEVMEEQILRLETEISQNAEARELCRAIFREGCSYAALQADAYLGAVDRKAETVRELNEDRVQREPIPVRRYIARMLDSLLYGTIWNMILIGVFRVNISAQNEADGLGYDILGIIVGIGLMLVFETLLLPLTGTTPGKWIFGLRVLHTDGSRLTWREAFDRTWLVILRGQGLEIPVYSLYRLYKSCVAAGDGQPLEWELETDSIVEIKDRKWWRFIGCAAAFVISVVMTAGVYLYAQMPPNRGDITVAEFAENYNYLTSFYNMDVGIDLDEEGKWFENSNDEIIIIGGEDADARPQFTYTVREDGVLTGIDFTVHQQNTAWMVSSYESEMAIAAMAFAGAAENRGLVPEELDRAAEVIASSAFQDFEIRAYEVLLRCDVEYSGFDGGMGSPFLFPKENAENEFYLKFAMKKMD